MMDHEYYPIGKIKDVTVPVSDAEELYSTALSALRSYRGEFKPEESDDFIRGYKIGKDVGNFYDYILGRHPMASGIEKVIFNPPATIVIWKDGSKTVVKCKEGDQFDKWAGLSLCISKKILGKDFHRFFRKYCEEDA